METKVTYRGKKKKVKENGNEQKRKKEESQERWECFRKIIEKFSQQKVMVIGDFISDIYIYGKPSKLSREAPVVVINHESERIVPGGAGNATNNLASLGCQVYSVGILGNDELGNNIISQLNEKKVNVDGLLLSHIVTTTSKTRIMAGDEHTSKQQVIRIDKANKGPIPSRLQQKICNHFLSISQDVNAVVVSDYGYGVIFRRIIPKLQALAKQKIVVVDSRYQLLRFRGVTAITPNESEAEKATRIRLVNDQSVSRAAYLLKERLGLKAVLITRGNRGMTLLDKSRKIFHIPIVGSDDITDVTGAGDTVATIFTLALASGANFFEAASLANYAASIVVMKSGTAVITKNELLEAVKKDYEGSKNSS